MWTFHNSAYAYHFPTTAGSRSQQSHPTYLYPRATVNAGENHKVCYLISELSESFQILMLEYSFMAHPDTLLPMTTIEDPIQRFVAVVKFYLSGWHIKPPCVPSTPIYHEQYLIRLQRGEETA